MAIHAETIRRFSRRASCGFRPSFCLPLPFYPVGHSFFSHLRHDLSIPVYLRSIAHCSLSTIQHVCPKDSSSRAGTLIRTSPPIVDVAFLPPVSSCLLPPFEAAHKPSTLPFPSYYLPFYSLNSPLVALPTRCSSIFLRPFPRCGKMYVLPCYVRLSEESVVDFRYQLLRQFSRIFSSQRSMAANIP